MSLVGCSTLGGTSSGNNSSSGQDETAAVIKGLGDPLVQALEEVITGIAGQAGRLAFLAGQDYYCFIINPISGNNLLKASAQLKASGKTGYPVD